MNSMDLVCEKDNSGRSEYYCAQDFGLHKNVSLANYYRSGKFGAKPFLGSPIFIRRHDK